MSNREKIIDKIKKCLALSASSNEHEAAAALRQAKKLMESHGISDTEMLAAEVSEKRSRSGAVRSPSVWETTLAGKIADAFACRLVHAHNWERDCGEWRFIGTGAAPEVSEYAFKVLFRQAKSARAEHIKSRLKRCRPAIKTRRADLYSQGWVNAVTALIDRFAGGETNPAAVDAYMESKYPRLGDLKSRDRISDRSLRQHEQMDYYHGRNSGREAELNRGVDAEDNKLLLG